MEQPTLRRGLIDTDILVDWSRGFTQATEFLNEAFGSTGITISAVTVLELIAGCRNSAQLADVKRSLARFTVLPLNERVSNITQSLMEEFTLSHGLLLADALIAAAALDSGLALYTKNIRHFRMIPELLIIQPY